MTGEVGSDSDAGSQPVYPMTDNAILDVIFGWQLGFGHSMCSKKIPQFIVRPV